MINSTAATIMVGDGQICKFDLFASLIPPIVAAREDENYNYGDLRTPLHTILLTRNYLNKLLLSK